MHATLLPRRRASRRATAFWPDTAPLAGIVLLLALVYALEDFQSAEGPAVSLPSSTPSCCSDPDPDSPSVVITMTKEGRLFLIGSRKASIFNQLAKRQGISLSVNEYQQLSALHYVATPVADLPAYLALSPAERQAAFPPERQPGIPLSQVTDFIEIAQSQTPYQLYCYLRVDQDLPCSRLKLLMNVISELNIRHFRLITDSKPIDIQTTNLLY
jgi:biopolymer transport protein ExbD